MAEDRGSHGHVSARAGARRLDLLGFGLVTIITVCTWLPTLASGRRINMVDDYLMHASRHEAVRKSLVEYHQFPLRSPWFGGGFPTLGEPEDPALNPLVLLSVVFGSAIGLKLIGFTAALASGLGAYGLALYVLRYTWCGALFSGVVLGAGVCIPACMPGGNIGELCAAYLPLCLLLIGLSCRGRWVALLLLPLVLCSMLSQGKQTFAMVVLYMGVVCLLDLGRTFSTLAPTDPARRLDVRPLAVLVIALGAALLIGMVRILPMLDFIRDTGGLTHMALEPYPSRVVGHGPDIRELAIFAVGLEGTIQFVAIGWVPVALFAVSACCFWRSCTPWTISLVLAMWLCMGERAPVNLFGLVQGLPVFSAIPVPGKYFYYQIVFSIGIAGGQAFWLLPRLRHRLLEGACALALIGGALAFLYPRATLLQHQTYTYGRDIGPYGSREQEQFFQIRGVGLIRTRVAPDIALTYFNLLQNVGTIDWHGAVLMPEHAVPKFVVDAEGRTIPNHRYRGEAYLVGNGSVLGWTVRPDSVTADVAVDGPAILVINQNYHPAWRTDGGELVQRDGLLAVQLREAGQYTVHLRYLPPSFVAGLAVSVVGLVGWVLACRRWGRGQGGPGATAGARPGAGRASRRPRGALTRGN